MDRTERIPVACWLLVVCVAAIGLGLIGHEATVSSATYDEVTYLDLASVWWRSGGTETITRMGSPVTFFKLQSAPVFWVLDQLGNGSLIDEPILNQAKLLPLVRIGSLWIWLVGFGLTVAWSARNHGPRAMMAAAILFTMSPNLLAHGSLMTMEMPLIAATAGLFLLFDSFLRTGGRWTFVGSAVASGLAFSCKFTAVLIPPILTVIWLVNLRIDSHCEVRRLFKTVGLGMTLYGLIMIVTNLIITGFSLLPLSDRVGDHPAIKGGLGWLVEIPIPQDWVGFATQVLHQRNGGPSYLLGHRRMTGWWYYYPVALAVKLPIALWVLIVGRGWLALRDRHRCREWILPLAISLFIVVAMVGSKRNYGVRYLLPLAPLAIVWISSLAQQDGAWRWVLSLGLVGQSLAVASSHPYELSFFNQAVGGTLGGRRILADSNLDWGQGLRLFARLEGKYPSMTFYYFGDTSPGYYGIKCQSYVIKANPTQQPLPNELQFSTRYIAVSASLQYGPWGPAGYFDRLNGSIPVKFTDDGTIAIYDTESL